MSELFNDFISMVPWLIPALSILLGCTIVYLIVMVPAYFIFWPFFDRVGQNLENFTQLFLENLNKVQISRNEQLDNMTDEFKNDSGLSKLKSGVGDFWSVLLEDLIKSLQNLMTPVDKVNQSIANMNGQIPDIKKKIDSLHVNQSQKFPEFPSLDEITESARSLRIAKFILIGAGIILFFLMSINTGMLSRILRELGVIPAAMVFIGIRLSYVFAFILALVEAGLGFAHGAKRKKDSDQISLWPTMMIIFAIIFAFVEGFFWSRIASGIDVFNLPFFDYPVHQTSIYFFFGFVLVMTLFTLGSICFDAAVSILKDSEINTLNRELKKHSKIQDQYRDASSILQKNLAKIKETLKNINEIIIGTKDNTEGIRAQLDKVLHEVIKLKDRMPEFMQQIDDELSRSDIYQLAQKAGLWITLSILGIVAVTITGLNSFAAFYPDLDQVMLWILSFGQAVIFFGIGFLLGTDESVLQGKDNQKKVIVSQRFSQLAAKIIGSLLITTYLVLLFILAIPINIGAVWISNLIVGLFLIAVGYQLNPLMNVGRIWLIRLWNFVMKILEYIWLAVVRLTQIIVVVLEYIFYLFAVPLERFFNRKHKEKKEEALV